MDLAQKATRVKRDLQAALHKPEATSIKHALDSFESFADAVVEEIAQLKKESGNGSTTGNGLLAPESIASVAPPAEPAESELEGQAAT